MATPHWRRRWHASDLVQLSILRHDNNMAIIIPNGLSHSWVRKLFAEAAKVYAYGNPHPTPATKPSKKRRKRG
jgi:hypothetical protein